ncbi:MAG TPA: hypothetical protein DIV44_03330 [Leeuwenhoekiella sp.]|uniref:hypothetical protein n=1 Tax=Leeuwenhoekiella palythoae TaxID=573501 RepID=UPI000E9055E5|nr:hypothetical protein [Leeuwenhoekiella palythoae]UBZ11887.1 hypothetical protein LDL79_07150 [Leeuwenhoekiella palythoae]HAX15399.1 hypothetical protein [Leeuwenhoekiella sp.]HBO30549.1 hypothetical protein [Leeuwenhoekiella sp.]HCQ75818.1 hypothetical protein [Leeuwenhoekiella sp.]|tara:strand:- start:386 stop:784 length:399 start_codon:yes stop_codon:yes gene_type:complete
MSIFNLSEHISKVSDDAKKYLNSSLEYYKLDSFKKMMDGAVSLVNLMVSGSIFLIFILFISVGVAIVIGESLGSLSYGYFIVAGIYLAIYVLYKLFGKPFITEIVLRKYSKVFFNESSQEDVLDEEFKHLQE